MNAGQASTPSQKEQNMKRTSLVVIFIIAILASACNLPSGAPQTDAELIFTLAAQTLTASALTQGAQPAAATNTPLPCNLASFVTDVTISDNTEIQVNKAFTKTWRLKNVGSCTWTSGYQLIFDSGDKMGGPDSQKLTDNTVAPGQTVDVSVNLTAPGATGTYKGNWKIRDPNGVIFGLSTGSFYLIIKAINPSQSDWRTFKSGDSGPEVYAIQYLLLAHGYALTADGNWGPVTQSTVEDFQTDNGLKEDIVVGPETWTALIIQTSQGKAGPEVRAIQHLLKFKFGMNGLAVDGIFGPDTANAVKSFQTSHGLSVDGIVGPNTWKALINN